MALTNEPGAQVGFLRWGLAPAWAPTAKFDYATFNARSESAPTSRTYREPGERRQPSSDA